MNKYETLFIAKPDLPEEEIESALDRLKKQIDKTEGKVAAIDYWGHRNLAYSVRYRGERLHRGYYILLTYLGSGVTVEEIERNIKIMDPIFRYLTVKQEDDVDPDSITEVEITKKREEAPRQIEEPGPAAEASGEEKAGQDDPGDAEPESEEAETDEAADPDKEEKTDDNDSGESTPDPETAESEKDDSPEEEKE